MAVTAFGARAWARRALVVLVVLLLAMGSVRAQGEDVEDLEDDEDGEEVFLENVSTQSGEVSPEVLAALTEIRQNLRVRTIFPNALFGNLESGKMAEILISADNLGEIPFQIVMIEGSFRAASDYSFVMQNFTAYRYDVDIAPYEQASMSYRWYIGSVYEPIELRLEVILTVGVEGGAFKYPAHNETVTVVDPVRGLFDLQSLFLYAVVAAALAGLGYAVYTNFIAKRLVGRNKKAAAAAAAPVKGKGETGASNKPVVDMDWIPAEQRKLATPRKR